MARSVRILDITPQAGKWPNILNATVPGVPRAQVARVIASYEGREERIAIVFEPFRESPDRAAIMSAVREQLKDFHVSYVDAHQLGAPRVWLEDSSSAALVFLAAAAAAALQYTWGWDESPSITVHSGDQSFRFQVRAGGDDRSQEVVELTAA